MVSFREASNAWYKEQRVALRQQIELMESGRLITRERTAESPQWVDTTAESLERAKGQLAQIESLLARYTKER